MLKVDVIAHYAGGRAVARELDVSTVAVYKWGPVIPYWAAMYLQRRTRGALKVQQHLYSRGRPLTGADLRRALESVRRTERKKHLPLSVPTVPARRTRGTTRTDNAI